MITGLPLWTATLDIANSSLAKKVPYSIALASEHMATDPISIVGQVKDISSISIDIDFDETLDKLHRCTLKVHLPSGEPLKTSCEASKKQQAKKAAHAAIIEMEAWKSFARQAREEKETERDAQQARRAHGSELDDEYAARVFAQARASRDLLGGVEDLIDRPGVSDVSELHLTTVVLSDLDVSAGGSRLHDNRLRWVALVHNERLPTLPQPPAGSPR